MYIHEYILKYKHTYVPVHTHTPCIYEHISSVYTCILWALERMHFQGTSALALVCRVESLVCLLNTVYDCIHKSLHSRPAVDQHPKLSCGINITLTLVATEMASTLLCA